MMADRIEEKKSLGAAKHGRGRVNRAHDIGGVSGDHEIHLGNWHHGKVATHGG